MNDLEAMELKISKFLRSGVIVSGAMIGTGWILGLSNRSENFWKFEQYDHIPLQNFLIYYYNQGNWPSLLSYAGLTVLILLPLIRVLLTGILFIRQKDYLLAFIAAVVLLSLVISFSFGIEI